MPNFLLKEPLARFNAGFLSARIGEWLFAVALNWVVYTQTESPLLLAVVNACRLLPNLVCSVPAGQLADKWDRQRLNVVAALLNAVLTLAVGLALLVGLPFGFVAFLVAARAVVTAAEGPFRNAYLCSLFCGERLKTVVAQNASIMNLGRIVGPVLAGTMLATTGSTSTFVLASLLTIGYGGTLASLPKLAQNPAAKKQASKSTVSLAETLRQFPELKKLLLLAIPVMFFGFPFTAMLPLITETLLGLGSEEFGALLAVSASGALLASSQLSLNPSASTWTRTRVYALCFGAVLLGLVMVESFVGAALLLFWIGYFGQAYRTSSRMLFQELVPRERAGKLLGIALMDRGLIPIGGLVIGAIAEWGDLRMAIAFMGLGCLACVGLFFPSLTIRRGWALAGTSLAVTLTVLLTGCLDSGKAPSRSFSGPSTQLEHSWGTTEVPLRPKRIVVLDLPFLDAFCALGQPVVGFAGTSDKAVPAYLKDRLPDGNHPTFVGERKQPNLEVIYSLKPDLIVANPDRHKMIRQQLESVAPTIALTDDSLDQVREMIRVFAVITDRNDESGILNEQLALSLEQVRQTQVGQPRVLLVGAFEDEFSTWTEGSFIGSLFQEMGADYAFKEAPRASESQTEVAKVTIEGLAQLNPDFLFVYGDPSRWDQNHIYRGLQANLDERVLQVDRDLWSRARGPVAAQHIMRAYRDFLKQSQKVAVHSEPT